MKYFALQILFSFLLATHFSLAQHNLKTAELVDNSISEWHSAAATADYSTYIKLMTKDAIFIGTDPTEHWKGKEFLDFAKPYFDKGKAWTFHKLERKIYLAANEKTAWFDELLDTQMGICRGSGVLSLVDGKWKIKHYVLSISIPNANVKVIKEMNESFNQSFINSLETNH